MHILIDSRSASQLNNRNDESELGRPAGQMECINRRKETEPACDWIRNVFEFVQLAAASQHAKIERDQPSRNNNSNNRN